VGAAFAAEGRDFAVSSFDEVLYVDTNQIEQAKRQLNMLEQEIARLSESDMAPADYYSKFLELLLQALMAPAGAIWIRTPQGNLVLQCQASIREVGIDRTAEDRQMHDELLRQAALQAKPAIVPPSTSRTLEGDGTVVGNPTPYVVLLAPILYEKEVVGLVEVWHSPTHPQQVQQNFLGFILKMSQFASTFTRNHRLRQMTGQQALWIQLEAFARQVHGSLNPVEVSYWIANEGRRLVECDRISVGTRTGKKVDVLAVSGADVVEKRSNLVQRMRDLFKAVIDWGEKLVYTGTKDESLPPDVLEALDHYLAESNSQVLVVLPIRDEREKDAEKKCRNAFLLESFEPKIGPQILVERLEVIAKHAGPALYNAVEHRRIPMRWIWMPLAAIQEGLGGKARTITSLVIAGVVALILAMIFIPYPLKMSANGQELPIERRWVYSPWPGEVKEIKTSLKSGSQISKGQELMVLFDTKLAEMINQLTTEMNTAENMMRMTIKPNPDGTEDKEASLQKKNAEITRAAKLAELKQLRDLYNADVSRPGYFVVRSPLTGRILNTDFRENLVGRRVQPNEPLLRIGSTTAKPKLTEWEVELKIPQKHVGQVLRALERKNVLDVDLLLSNDPTHVYVGKLTRDKLAWQLSPNKDAHDEPEPVVSAYVRIYPDKDGDIPEGSRVPPELLVTGTEVHSRVRCGNHAMGYSLLYGIWEFTFEKVIFYLWP
jgi:hypothetical protein